MTDQFREVTTTSWSQRIQESLAGIAFGFLLFIASFFLLAWNEGRSHDRLTALAEGASAVVPVDAAVLSPDNDGKLVHFTGQAVTQDIVRDPDFGIGENALALRRTVQMFQWEEEQSTKTVKNMGGSETTETVYNYKKTWAPHHIDSSLFKQPLGHQNPPSLPFEGKEFRAGTVTTGSFRLGQDFTKQITTYDDYSLTPAHYDALGEPLKSAFKLQGNEFIKGDPMNPQIGDVRVSFGIIRPLEVSVIGRQNKTNLEPYLAKSGTIALLETGPVSADLMFAHAQTENKIITWVVRAVGFLIMWGGLALILNPLSVLGDVVPIIGSLIGAGIGLITGIAALGLSFLTVALAWIATRPLIGLALLAGTALCGAGGAALTRRRKATPPAAQEETRKAA